MDWQPIATAPEGHYHADVWAFCSASQSAERYPNAVHRLDGVWFDCGGNKLNWERVDSDGFPHYRKVTHWMPNPSAPVDWMPAEDDADEPTDSDRTDLYEEKGDES